PVCVVRPYWLLETAPAPEPEVREPRTMLVPLNGSDPSLGILSLVVRLATSWSGRVVLLHVLPENASESEASTRGRLADIEDELKVAGIAVESIVDRGDPLARILDASRTRDIDL